MMVNAAPTVSVIIPTYNRPAYLREAIASVLAQSYPDFEVIVTDDASPEHASGETSQTVVNAFHDSRIRFRRNAANLGVARNVAAAVQMARGKFISTLNDDDRWTPQFLEKLVAPLEADPALVLAFCDYSVINAFGGIDPEQTEQQTRKEKRDRLQPGIYQPFWQEGVADQAVLASSAAVLRRDAIAWEELPAAGVFWDYYLVYLACRTGRGAFYCPERLMQYRIHPQSENMRSGSQDVQAKIRKGKAGVFCYEKFAADAPDALKPHFQREWAHAHTTLAIGLMRDRQFAAARPYLRRSLTLHPFNLRTLAALLLSHVPAFLAQSLVRLPNPGFSKAR